MNKEDDEKLIEVGKKINYLLISNELNPMDCLNVLNSIIMAICNQNEVTNESFEHMLANCYDFYCRTYNRK